ncbi:MAG TPA: DUF1573 domain-containing protein [Candidatus Krumholzibacteria bacterium]|nr:DUF1573 domain-containing protein [Candidatus Krumholzibacteria bacterium]HPD72439.1 DUF1573 domain-containing protein [Candidatus Krumholzibacteria bacterium]HRY40629.1 DUF1573 domain-containing protein [Candidatus Krumholzibacteria bacterium]
MRSAIASLLFLLMPVLVAAQPRLEVEPEELDFGDLQGHEIREAVVTIRNAGTEPLEIRDIESTCGCTVPALEVREIAPGESTRMTVEFNSKTFQGAQVKYIHIYTNDPARPSFDLLVSADIKVPLSMDPPKSTVEFKTVKIGETSTVTYTFRTEDVPKLELRPTDWPKEWLDIAVRPGQDPRSVLVDFTVRPDSPAGRHRGSLKLATNLPTVPVVDLEADVKLVTDLVVTPERLNLATLPPGGPVKSKIRVAPYRPGTPFELTRAEIDIPGLKVRVENGARECFALIDGAALAADDPLAVKENGRIRGTLRIFTSLASSPELEIPVTYMIRR